MKMLGVEGGCVPGGGLRREAAAADSSFSGPWLSLYRAGGVLGTLGGSVVAWAVVMIGRRL